MKIIIEHGNAKREINGPFNICGSKEDLCSLRDQLNNQLESHSFIYGWVNILCPKQKSITNTPPIEWQKEG